MDYNDRITEIMKNCDIRSNMPDDCPEKSIFFVRSDKQTNPHLIASQGFDPAPDLLFDVD